MKHNIMAEAFLIIASIPVVLLCRVRCQTFPSPHYDDASDVPICGTVTE